MAAFGTRPTATSYNVYTDISDYLRASQGNDWTFTRGRQSVTGKMNAGQGTWLLDNRYLYFEQLNVDGPFGSDVLPEVGIKSYLEYPWLPGQLANGDFRSSPAWTGTSATTSWNQPIDELAQGELVSTATAAGTHSVKSPVVLVPAAQVGQTVVATARARRISGSALNDVRLRVHFYSNSAGTTLISSSTGSSFNFNTYGTPRFTRQATIPAGTVSLRVELERIAGSGAIAVGNQTGWQSVVVEWTNINFQQDQFTGYADSWICKGDVGDNTCILTATDNYGKLGTRKLNTPKYGDYLRSVGFDKWYRLGESVRTQFDVNSLTFKDEITGLSDANVDNTPNPDSILVPGFGFGPDSYFPIYNRSSFVGNGPLASADGSSPLDPDFAFSLVGPSSGDSGCIQLPTSCQPTHTTWTYAIWVRSVDGLIKLANNDYPDADLGFNYDLLRIGQRKYDFFGGSSTPSPYTTLVAYFEQTTGLLNYALTDAATGAVLEGVAVTNFMVDAEWHLVVFTYASSPKLKLYVDGNYDSTADYTNGSGPITFPTDPSGGPGGLIGEPWSLTGTADTTTGTILDVRDVGWKFEVDEFLFRDGAVLSDATILAMYQKAKIAYPIETVVSRYNKVLADASWPSPLRTSDIGPGVQTEVTAITAPFAQDNPLTYLQLLEDADQGLLFATREGQIKLVTHRQLVNATSDYSAPTYTLSNGNEGVLFIPYEQPGGDTANNKDLLYTQAVVNVIGGTGQYADDIAAQGQFDIRSIDAVRDLPLDKDEKAAFIATWLLAVFSTPGTKIKSLIVNPFASDSALKFVRDTELGDAVAVRLRPPGVQYAPTAAPSGYFPITAQVQGIRATGSRNNMRVIYDLDSTYSKRWMQFADNFGSYDMAL